MSVLRRPPVTLSMVSARVRRKNVGVEAIRPNEASAMPPDLMKYLLFMTIVLKSVFARSCPLIFVLCTLYFDFYPQALAPAEKPLSSKYQAQSTKFFSLLLPLKLRRTENQAGKPDY